MSSGQELERLEEIMRTLRSDRGCPLGSGTDPSVFKALFTGRGL